MIFFSYTVNFVQFCLSLWTAADRAQRVYARSTDGKAWNKEKTTEVALDAIAGLASFAVAGSMASQVAYPAYSVTADKVHSVAKLALLSEKAGRKFFIIGKPISECFDFPDYARSLGLLARLVTSNPDAESIGEALAQIYEQTSHLTGSSSKPSSSIHSQPGQVEAQPVARSGAGDVPPSSPPLEISIKDTRGEALLVPLNYPYFTPEFLKKDPSFALLVCPVSKKPIRVPAIIQGEEQPVYELFFLLLYAKNKRHPLTPDKSFSFSDIRIHREALERIESALSKLN